MTFHNTPPLWRCLGALLLLAASLGSLEAPSPEEGPLDAAQAAAHPGGCPSTAVLLQKGSVRATAASVQDLLIQEPAALLLAEAAAAAASSARDEPEPGQQQQAEAEPARGGGGGGTGGTVGENTTAAGASDENATTLENVTTAVGGNSTSSGGNTSSHPVESPAAGEATASPPLTTGSNGSNTSGVSNATSVIAESPAANNTTTGADGNSTAADSNATSGARASSSPIGSEENSSAASSNITSGSVATPAGEAGNRNGTLVSDNSTSEPSSSLANGSSAPAEEAGTVPEAGTQQTSPVAGSTTPGPGIDSSAGGTTTSTTDEPRPMQPGILDGAADSDHNATAGDAEPPHSNASANLTSNESTIDAGPDLCSSEGCKQMHHRLVRALDHFRHHRILPLTPLSPTSSSPLGGEPASDADHEAPDDEGNASNASSVAVARAKPLLGPPTDSAETAHSEEALLKALAPESPDAVPMDEETSDWS